jgi:thioesterase domain-containing protein
VPEFKTLMPIRRKGNGLPLFLVHGEPLRFVQEMSLDRPVYGLSHVYHADFVDVSPESIQSLAAEYLSEVRQVQPTGPYQFCGYSAGGMIAYEMARQLIEIGETVDELILIEPTCYQSEVKVKLPATTILDTSTQWNKILKLIKRLPKSIWARTRNASLMLLARLLMTFGRPLPQKMRWLGYLKSLKPAMSKYVFRPIDAKAILLYRNMTEENEQLTCEFWGALLLEGVAVEVFPNVMTHHEFMWDPTLGHVVELIEERYKNRSKAESQ